MTKTDIAKTAISFVVGSGVSKIVSGIVIRNTNPQKITDKVAVVAAGVALSGVVAERTKKYTDNAVDGVVKWWDENITKKLES